MITTKLYEKFPFTMKTRDKKDLFEMPLNYRGKQERVAKFRMHGVFCLLFLNKLINIHHLGIVAKQINKHINKNSVGIKNMLLRHLHVLAVMFA